MCLGAIYWARLDRLYFACGREDAMGCGFDDAFIYEELALPPEQRTVKGEQLLREEGIAAFEDWARSPAKIRY
jgi:tRNA(Arg) A34 adenosine deaminase TadA